MFTSSSAFTVAFRAYKSGLRVGLAGTGGRAALACSNGFEAGLAGSGGILVSFLPASSGLAAACDGKGGIATFVTGLLKKASYID